jgi:hypothetical protein
METSITRQRHITAERAVGTMTAEIHCMKVKYSHLNKAHEKMIGDSETRVSRSDTIPTQTRTQGLKACKGSHNTCHCFQRKLHDIRIKLKQWTVKLSQLNFR